MSIDGAIENAVASLKMEGFEIDEESINWCKELLENKIDFEQYLLLVKQKAGVISKWVTV